MLFRIHQNVHFAKISPDGFKLVCEGIINIIKKIVNDIKNSLLFWPIGLVSMSSKYISVSVDCGKKIIFSSIEDSR